MQVRRVTDRELRLSGDGVEAVVLLHPDGVEVGQLVAPGLTRAGVETLMHDIIAHHLVPVSTVPPKS